jgi:hypothetical protein
LHLRREGDAGLVATNGINLISTTNESMNDVLKLAWKVGVKK